MRRVPALNTPAFDPADPRIHEHRIVAIVATAGRMRQQMFDCDFVDIRMVRRTAICCATIDQAVLGPIKAFFQFIAASGWPKPLCERPRTRVNYRDTFVGETPRGAFPLDAPMYPVTSLFGIA